MFMESKPRCELQLEIIIQKKNYAYEMYSTFFVSNLIHNTESLTLGAMKKKTI